MHLLSVRPNVARDDRIGKPMPHEHGRFRDDAIIAGIMRLPWSDRRGSVQVDDHRQAWAIRKAAAVRRWPTDRQGEGRAHETGLP